MTTESVNRPSDVANVTMSRWLQSGALIAAAALVGFGLVLFIAANWDEIGRFGRFGLAASVVLAGGLGALVWPSLQKPLLLLAFAATGGMLALIGQTYQTGADAWQLFALWAALTLPWALVARSDAIWTPWAIVALTAIGLWQQTFAGMGWQIDRAPRLVLLAAWIAALAVPAALSPHAALERWLGTARWAFRVSLCLALALIAKQTIEAILDWPRLPDIAVLGILLLAAVAGLLVLTHDIAMLAVTALSLDTVLIAALVRIVMPRHGNDAGSFIVIGIGAAMIVAGSVVAIMRAIRSFGTPTGSVVAAPQVRDVASRPWPVVLLSGLGAVIAAVPFIVAFAIIFGRALEKGSAAYILAIVLLPVALATLRSVRSLFVEQLATVALAVGLGLLTFALFRDLPIWCAGLLLAMIAMAIALGLGRTWIGVLLGAMAAACFGAFTFGLLPRELTVRGTHAAIFAGGILVAAWLAMTFAREAYGDWLERHGMPSLEATLSGWIGMTLIGLAISSGPTFLLGSPFGSPGFGTRSAAGFATLIAANRILSIVLGVGASAWLLWQRPVLRTPLGIAIGLVGIGLSAAMPTLGPVAAVLALAITGGRRVIALAAAVAAMWIAGSFYYNLSLTLTEKAAILAIAGGMLGVVALASGARMILDPARLASGGAPVLPSHLGRGLSAAGLVVICALSAQAINEKEALIRNGQPVFVELVPVDPRSLMQGDYMALRFALPDSALRHHPLTGSRPRAIGKIDPDGVVRLTRIGDARTELAPGEIRIELSPKRGRWIVVTDAWFFKEGTAKKWEAARYGEFRVLPDGRALLVGLADKDRILIR